MEQYNKQTGKYYSQTSLPIITQEELEQEMNGGHKMTTLKEEALAYEPQQTMNIADLDTVSIDIELKDGDGIDSKGIPFTYKYTEIKGINYRVPGSVIGGIKAVLLKMPDLKNVSIIKQGQGMNTRYNVIPAKD